MSACLSAVQPIGQRPLVIYPAYITLMGDHAGAVVLSEVLFWRSRHGKKFTRTDAEFEREAMVSREQFRRIKNKMKDLGFLTIKAEGLPAKTAYDVDFGAAAKAGVFPCQ